MEPDSVTRELQVSSMHAGVTREQLQAATGWALKFAPQMMQTALPSVEEIATLRALQQRTEAAHAAR